MSDIKQLVRDALRAAECKDAGATDAPKNTPAGTNASAGGSRRDTGVAETHPGWS